MKLRERKAITVVMTMAISALIPLTAFAGNNYAENAGKWVLDQAFWVILVIGIIGAGMAIVKRAYTAGIITALAVGVVCFFCKNPDKLTSIGESLSNTFFK